MHGHRDGMMLVRAQLCEQLTTMQSLAGGSAARDLAQSIRSFRSLAASYGLTPVVRLAEAMEQDVAHRGLRGARGPVALYFERLEDAIGCGRADEQASQALIASIAIRLGA